jgi:hypothetical protein
MSEKSEWEKRKIAEFRREIEEKNKNLDVKVTVTNEGLEDAIEEKKALREKTRQLEAKLEKAEEAEQLFDEMRSKVENQYIEAGLRTPNITDKDSLNDAIENLGKIEKLEQNQQRGGSGSAPLNSAQITGGSPSKQGYDSQAEMIEDLQSKAHLGDANADAVLGKLLEKTLQGVKQNKRGFGQIETPETESEIQRINRINREKHIRNLNKRMEGEN